MNIVLAYNGTQNFIPGLTRARFWPLSWARHFHVGIDILTAVTMKITISSLIKLCSQLDNLTDVSADFLYLTLKKNVIRKNVCACWTHVLQPNNTKICGPLEVKLGKHFPFKLVFLRPVTWTWMVYVLYVTIIYFSLQSEGTCLFRTPDTVCVLQELSPLVVRLEPSVGEMFEAMRALLLATHWHSFTVLADSSATSGVLLRRDLASILNAPPLNPTLLLLRSGGAARRSIFR